LHVFRAWIWAAATDQLICIKQEGLALASMAQDDPPASSTVSSTAAAMRGKVGLEFET